MKSHWTKLTLESCISLKSGGTPSKQNPDFWNGDIPWVSTKDMHRLRLTDTEDHITDAAIAEGSKLVPPGTILISVRGMRLTNNLPIVEVQREASFNQDLKALSCKKNIVSRFLLYWLIANEYQILGRCDEASHGTKRLKTEQLLSMPIVLPPLAEQQQIADTLSAYDDLIDNNNRRIALLEESVHLLYREWFLHLRFPGHDQVKVVDGIPEGWEEVTIADLYTTSSGGTPSRKRDDYFGGQIPWIKTQELNNHWILDTEEKITEAGLSNSSAKLFPAGTFIVAMYGATICQFGILAIECTTNQACCAILRNPESPFSYAYTFGYFLTERSKIISMGQGSAQPNISQKVIKELKILKPPQSIIIHYNSIVEPWLEAMLCYQQMNSRLQEARDRLLPRLMNGSLVV